MIQIIYVKRFCSYNLSGPTGAIQVNIKPTSGSVVGDQTVELQAKSGCKVLDGRSTDKETRIARAGGNGYSSQNSVSFSTVPAGSFSVRIQYKGQWTGYKGVDVVSAQNKTVEFTVDGETPTSTPTPTPLPKSTCAVEVPSISGTDPLTANLAYSAKYSGNKYVAGAQWDFTGDGSWDTDMSLSNGSLAHTFSSAGSYTIKLRLKMSDEELTETCSKTITLTSGK